MVSSNEVKALMVSRFPYCPICSQNKGYDVLGVENTTVSCKKCNATWRSEDFKNGQAPSKLTLTQPASDGTGRYLLRKPLSVDFWRNWREELKAEMDARQQARVDCLLQCKNAVLSQKEFRYLSDEELFEKAWLIEDMSMAIVQDDGSLMIMFKDKTKREFILSVDNWTKISEAGILLFGGISTTIAGNMAIDNKIKAMSQQWASAINALISKSVIPEMIYCKYCRTKNKSTDSLCVHCGGILA
jgi:hypothetical protein